MRTKAQSPSIDETIAFILFIFCVALSFFHQPSVDIAVTLVN